MATDLETLRADVEKYLGEAQVTAFHGFTGPSDLPTVYWDIRREPDFRAFVNIAQKLGVKIIVVDRHNFLLDEIDEVREQLQESDLTREEKRAFERRIAALQKFEGFTSRLELSFSLDGRLYVYHAEAEWYRVWEEIVSEVDAVTSDAEDPTDDGRMPGYFSAN